MRLYIKEGQSPVSIINTFFETQDSQIEFFFPEQTDFFDDPENLTLLRNQALLTKKRFLIAIDSEMLAQKLEKMGVPVVISQEEETLDGKKAKLTERRGEIDGVTKEVEEEGEFFEGIQEELKTPDDEFTKRYFDLGAPKSQKEKSQAQRIEVFEEIPPSSLLSGQDQWAEGEAKKEKKPLETLLGEDLKLFSGKIKKITWYKIGGIVFVFLLAFWGFFALPEATVKVFAAREKVSFIIDIIGQKNLTGVDIEKRSIPTQFIQITKEIKEKFKSETQGSFENKARGTITAFNEFTHPQAMIASRFQSLKGQIYWSQRNIKIPEAKFVQGKLQPGTLAIEVIADGPGENFNLDCSQSSPCQFTIPAWKGQESFTKVYARAEAPLRGGAMGQGFIVSEKEFKKAEAGVREKLLAQAQKELSAQVPPNLSLLENTINSQVRDIISSHKPGDFTKDATFTMQGKITLKAFLVKRDDVKDLIDKIVKSQLSENKVTRPSSANFEYSLTSFDFDEGKVLLKVQAQEEVSFKLNSEALKEQLIGKREDEVRKILSKMDYIQSAEVTLWPFWVRRIPQNSKKVMLEIN